jgi:hypothetical protein
MSTPSSGFDVAMIFESQSCFCEAHGDMDFWHLGNAPTQKSGIGGQNYTKSCIGEMALEGFIFTPESNKELTPEERARTKIDRSSGPSAEQRRRQEVREPRPDGARGATDSANGGL